MKMIYLQKNKKPRGISKFKIVSLVIVLLIVVQIFFPSILGGFFSSVMYPIWKADNVLSRSIRFTAGFIQSRATLVENNKELREDLDDARFAMIERDKLKKENSDLKALLGREDDSSDLLGAILARPPKTPYDTVIVDLGRDLGVSAGDPVFGQGGAMLGHVQDVRSNTSQVLLLSAPDANTSVVVDRTNISLEAFGLGGGNFRIEAPRDADVKEGDVLVFSNSSRSIIGIVAQVDVDPKESFKKILAKVPVNISELEWVVIKKQ